MAVTARPLRVAIVCSGLDHINRGYESFSRELLDVLAPRTDLESWLVKGSGDGSAREHVVRVLRRDRPSLRRLASVVGRPAVAYEIEAVSMAPGLVADLRRSRPDVVVTSDRPIALGLALARRMARLPARILFSNGAPHPGPFPYADLVQHLTENALQIALARGELAERAFQVPYALAFPD